MADRMDWRKVDDIKAHAGDFVQATFRVFEGAVGFGIWSARARKVFIPGAKSS